MSFNGKEGAGNINNDTGVAESAKSKIGKLKLTTPYVILATAVGTVLILAVAAFLVPGLNSLKIRLFQASVEIESREDAYAVLEGMRASPRSRLLLQAWLEKERYVSLDIPDEIGDPEERKELARKAASRFGDMVPAEPLQFTGSEEEMIQAIEAFKASTSEETLVGQLRRRSEGRAPPFNIVGDKAHGSVPQFTRDLPKSRTVHIWRDADFARYLTDGEIVELINPRSPAARPLLAAVRKVNIGSGTDVHLQRRQWCWLDLQSSAETRLGIGETAPLIIVPKRYIISADEQPGDIPGQVDDDFLTDDPPDCF